MISPIVLEHEWQALLKPLPLWQMPLQHTLVISPHPDDETLGAGGLIVALRAAHIEVNVVAVTDGEQAYFDRPNTDPPHLAALREQEQRSALALLGVDAAHIHRLHLPDSGLTTCEDELVDRLLPLVTPSTHIVAPWTQDFHPDHEVCGRAAQHVARRTGAALSFYFFWTWHRGTAALLDGLPLHRLPLTAEQVQCKQQALACHASQLYRADGAAILPPNLLAPVQRPFEVFLSV